MDEIALYQVMGMCDEFSGMSKEAFIGGTLATKALAAGRKLLTPVSGRIAQTATRGLTSAKAAPGGVASYIKAAPGKALTSAKEAPGKAKEWMRQGGRADRAVGRLATSGLGAGTGAAYGAATGEEGNRLQRAIGGAVLGGAAGLAAGQLVTGAGRRQLERATHRQIHGLTGVVPQRSLTGFSAPGRFNAPVAKTRLRDTFSRKGTSKFKDMSDQDKLKALNRLGVNTGTDASGKVLVDSAGKATGETARKAALSGLTSVPGFMKGLATKPIETLRTGTAAGGLMGAGIMGALTVPQIPHALKRTEHSGRAENIGQLIGETTGYVAGGAVPIAGNLALGAGLGAAGKYIGRGIGRLTGIGDKIRPDVGDIRRGA